MNILDKKLAINIIIDLKKSLPLVSTSIFDNIVPPHVSLDESLSMQAEALSYIGGNTVYDILIRDEETRKGNIMYSLALDKVTNIRKNLSQKKGVHLYIKQTFRNDERTYIMLDDMDSKSVNEMFRYGFEPVLVTETSKGNFQAILQFSQEKDMDFIEKCHYILKLMFDTDVLCDYHDHFTRMAGSINAKEKYIGTDKYHFPVSISHFDEKMASSDRRKSFSSEQDLVDAINNLEDFFLNDQPEVRKEIFKRRMSAEISENSEDCISLMKGTHILV